LRDIIRGFTSACSGYVSQPAATALPMSIFT
jgi:hypothetical protein